MGLEMKTTVNVASQSQKFVSELNIKPLVFSALVMALSASANAQSKTLEQLQAEIASMQACRASIDSPACNLDILDPEIRSLIIAVNEGERQLNRSQASQSKTHGATSEVGGCYFASIMSPSPFMGNDSEVFKLSDGSVWEVKYEYEYLYAYYPTVTVCPDKSIMLIDEKELNVVNLALTSASSPASVVDGCYDASITHPSPFMGNDSEVFKLSDGSVWEVKYEYEYMYEYQPLVTICPGNDTLIVDGKKLNVSNLSGVSTASRVKIVESSISGSWGGWQGNTIVKLSNGQIWEQVGMALSVAVGLGNEVLVFPKNGGYYMLVEDEDEAVQVVQLR